MANDQNVLRFPGAHLPAEPLWRELVGAALRSERTARRLTLLQVALRAGISPQYLSEVERGRKEPSSEMLGAIGGALDLPLLALLDRILVQRPIGNRLQQTSGPSGRPSGPVLMAV